MNSVRKGLRAGSLEKDTYERLLCANCETTLDTRDDPDDVGRLRVCPTCGREWHHIT